LCSSLSQSVENIDETIKQLTEAIDLVPNYASAYNNRAQAYRLKENYEAALNDLNKAIDLSVSAMKTTNNGQQREKERTVLKQALAQRVAVKKKQGDLAGSEEDRKWLAELTTPDNYYAKLCNETIQHVLANYRDYQDMSLDLPCSTTSSSSCSSQQQRSRERIAPIKNLIEDAFPQKIESSSSLTSLLGYLLALLHLCTD